MNIKIRHDTLYEYTQPISSLASEIHLRPLNNRRQIVESFHLETEPSTHVYDYTDRFGNSVHHFTIPRFLRTVRVRAISRINTFPQPFFYRQPEGFLLYESLQHTRRTVMDPLTQLWIEDHDRPGLPVRERAARLCLAVRNNFLYEPGVTTVQDTARDFIQHERGVCQDFAHFLLSVYRYLHIPALYVSGYVIPDGESPSASHAWVAIYGPDESGSREWTGLDPVSGELTDERYIWIGLGRDYDDVTPVRGVYWGNSQENLRVEVYGEE